MVTTDSGADVVPTGPTEVGGKLPVTVETGVVGRAVVGVIVETGTTEVGTDTGEVEWGWHTSLVQVTVWVTVMLLVPVVTEVIVLEPEVKVVVPTIGNQCQLHTPRLG